ncbi:MAG: acyltransferase [Acidimicrobiales bacterium]
MGFDGYGNWSRTIVKHEGQSVGRWSSLIDRVNPDAPPNRPRPATLQAALHPRSNSLNLLRLVLASAVVFSHSITLGGYGDEFILDYTTVGTIAVFCFFGVSGYLIAGSAEANKFGRFLWHRFLRIFPAFWICLVIVAFGFGSIGWIHGNHACGLSCYIRLPNGPFDYVLNNADLRITQLTIPGTLRGAPYPAVWNGSIWTLFYEFLCYLVIGVLAVVGLLRRKLAIIGVALAVWMVEVVVTATPRLNAQFNAFHHWEVTNLLRFIPVFLVGSILYLYRDRVPDSGWIALGSIALMLLTFLIPIGNGIPAATLTRSDLSAPLLVYPMLWLGAHLPGRSIGSRNDYSYGLYIYAFPMAQLLALWGVYTWGYVPFTVMTFLEK